MEERFRKALIMSGIPETIEHCLVENPEDADDYCFAGYPSIVLDGRDPFSTSSEQAGLTRRVYSMPDGAAGAPTVAQLIAAIEGVSQNGLT